MLPIFPPLMQNLNPVLYNNFMGQLVYSKIRNYYRDYRHIVLLILLFSSSVSVPTLPSLSIMENQFTVQKGNIYDPHGQQFIVKGIEAVYGTFYGGDESGFGAKNFSTMENDFAKIKQLGANLIRVHIRIDKISDVYKTKISQTVMVARENGFVVLLSVGGIDGIQEYPDAIPMLRYLANTYKTDPYIWIGAINEPNCGGPDCENWEKWQTDHMQYIKILREAGYRGPIVINSVRYSSDLSKIGQYPLLDDNLIYGIHKYGNNNTTLTEKLINDYNAEWANLALGSKYAFVIDEVGNFNGENFINSISWTSNFIDFATDWVANRGGDGVIAFNWYWSDANSLTTKNNELTAWGIIYKKQYLDKINNTIIKTPPAQSLTQPSLLPPSLKETPSISDPQPNTGTMSPEPQNISPSPVPNSKPVDDWLKYLLVILQRIYKFLLIPRDN